MLHIFINKIITSFKGEQYKLDRDIPCSYLFGLVWIMFLSFVWGKLRLRTFKRVFVHPSAVIRCAGKIVLKGNVTIDRGCYIDALSRNGLVLGNNVSFGYLTTLRVSGSVRNIGTGIIIGNNVGLGSHGFYGCGVGSLEIGDDCIFGNYVSIHPENHIFTDHDLPIRLQGVCSRGGVKIGNNCWIGAKVSILDGTRIGNGCIVAAGAVVKGEFPDNVIIGGVPAKILKYR